MSEARELLKRFMDQVKGKDPWGHQPGDFGAGREILAADAPVQIEVAIGSYGAAERSDFRTNHSLEKLRSQILRRKLSYTAGDVDALAGLVKRGLTKDGGTEPALVTAIEREARANRLSKDGAKTLREALDRANTSGAEQQKLMARLEAVLGGGVTVPLNAGEHWSDEARADLASLPEPARQAWAALMIHGLDAKGGKPTKTWSKKATAKLEAVGADAFAEAVARWFPRVNAGRSTPPSGRYEHEDAIDSRNEQLLKGLAWSCALVDDPVVARALTPLALTAYKKIPGIGPRAVALGNACIWALGHMPGDEGLAQLAILKAKVKFGTAQKSIQKALVATAERLGVAPDEVEEMAVPDYGMTAVGFRELPFEGGAVELRVEGRKPTLTFLKENGKRQKSIPKAVRETHPDEVRALKAAAKEIEKMLPAQADRIEQTYLADRSWDFPTFRARYLDHPLVGVLARNLIWRVSRGDTTVDVLWYDGALRDVQGASLEGDEGTVTLWHPLSESSEVLLAWRDRLEALEIKQPFKQAWREIYLLTDAERTTRLYSNRFAAHILKQHQFHALCQARGWKNKLRLLVDDTYPPAQRLMPAYGLRAEYWIEGIGDEYGTDTNEAGTFLRLVTDQVRFYPLDAEENLAHAGGGGYGHEDWGGGEPGDPVPVEDVPPLVLSEVLRDCDLFVGVASVGNDPTWADGGPQGHYRDYWQSYSFGELTETAETRKAVLERLLPRLEIRDAVRIEGRFLHVTGSRRKYKIHLGSGNILMEPNDQYLCIVRAAGGEKELFLPFEGDRTLALVLSKAFLLADDASIDDPTILSQIGP